MTLSTTKRKVFTLFLICVIIGSELVQFGDADKVFFKVLKAAKKLKKVKKLLPLLLLGPKILVIKTGQSQSSGYQSYPSSYPQSSYPSEPCPQIPVCCENDNSIDYSSQMSGYSSGSGGSSYSSGSGSSSYSGSGGSSYPSSSGGGSYPSSSGGGYGSSGSSGMYGTQYSSGK